MTAAAAYFDTRHQTMTAGRDGVFDFAYRQQVALLESRIEPGMTVLDVGCGPSLPYRADRAYVIGLDPSAASLAQNTNVDERIVGSAASIPLPDASVDLVVAFYAVHHMTGATTQQNCCQRHAALQEMRRVVRPGGAVLVFEMVPSSWAARLQTALWDTAKAMLGDGLDSYFWPHPDLFWSVIGARPSVRTFDAPPFSTFPPVFSLPWLTIPRCLYPLTPTLYEWSV